MVKTLPMVSSSRSTVTTNSWAQFKQARQSGKPRLIHSLDAWAEYNLNDQAPGDAVWFEVAGESREAYRRGWIEGRDWNEERRGHDK